MHSAARSEGARQAGLYLNELLLNSYRHRWLHVSDRVRHGKVNALAVAKVVAEYVRTNPTASRGVETEHAQIKDLVYRALGGKGVSRESLALLIAAFDMEEYDRAVLWGLWEERLPARVVVGELPPPRAAVLDPKFQTIQRHEFHYLGPSGQPVRHRTVQGIRALVDGYRRHRYTFDTSEVEVERVHGGEPSRPYRLAESQWAVDLLLPRTLNRGDEISMEFVTRFKHEFPLEACFRYAAHQRVEDVIFRVEFHSGKTPAAVWWNQWSDYRAPNVEILKQELVALDKELAVSRHLDVLESAVVGFSWSFTDRLDQGGHA